MKKIIIVAVVIALIAAAYALLIKNKNNSVSAETSAPKNCYLLGIGMGHYTPLWGLRAHARVCIFVYLPEFAPKRRRRTGTEGWEYGATA